VCDNGKGISREMREKVFYPNFTTKTSGTGLGLAISKNIVESFGGRIYFETEESVGTKFYFELPLLKNLEYDNSYRQAIDL
jgi:signal transduction histidine kinase